MDQWVSGNMKQHHYSRYQDALSGRDRDEDIEDSIGQITWGSQIVKYSNVAWVRIEIS